MMSKVLQHQTHISQTNFRRNERASKLSSKTKFGLSLLTLCFLSLSLPYINGSWVGIQRPVNRSVICWSIIDEITTHSLNHFISKRIFGQTFTQIYNWKCLGPKKTYEVMGSLKINSQNTNRQIGRIDPFLKNHPP